MLDKMIADFWFRIAEWKTKNKMSLRGVLATKQSRQKNLETWLANFRNEIATPFGLAMTLILGMRICDTRFLILDVYIEYPATSIQYHFNIYR